MNKILTKLNDVEPVIRHALDSLAIDEVTVVIVENATMLRNASPEGYTLEAGLFPGSMPKYYQLIVDCSKPSKLTLCHEMIHLQQMEEGRLRVAVKSGSCVWEGKTFDFYTPYDKRPWEAEAFKRQTGLLKSVQTLLKK